MIDQVQTSRVIPPLKSLSSFHVAALIFQYYGFTVAVTDLLQLLSKNSRNYLVSHREILKAFVKEWKFTGKTKVLSFGPDDIPWEAGFPTQKMIQREGSYREARPVKFIYMEESGYLTGASL